MRNACVVVLVVVLLLGAVSLAAADKISLQYKWVPDKELRYHVTETGTGNLDVTGGPQGMPGGGLFLDFGLDLRMKTRTVDAQGVGDVEVYPDKLTGKEQVFGMDIALEYDHGQAHMQVGDTVVFDSAHPVEGQPKEMTDMLAAVAGQSLVLRLDPTGKLVGLPQYALLQKLVPGLPPAEDLDKLLALSRGDLPDDPVDVGDTWERTQPIPMLKTAAGETITITTKYTFEKLEALQGHQCAKIVSTTPMAVANTGPMDLPAMPMAPQGTKMSLDLRKMEGEVRQVTWFDYENGCTVKSSFDVTMNMELGEKISVQLQDQPQTMDLGVKIDQFQIMGEVKLVEGQQVQGG